MVELTEEEENDVEGGNGGVISYSNNKIIGLSYTTFDRSITIPISAKLAEYDIPLQGKQLLVRKIADKINKTAELWAEYTNENLMIGLRRSVPKPYHCFFDYKSEKYGLVTIRIAINFA